MQNYKKKQETKNTKTCIFLGRRYIICYMAVHVDFVYEDVDFGWRE